MYTKQAYRGVFEVILSDRAYFHIHNHFSQLESLLLLIVRECTNICEYLYSDECLDVDLFLLVALILEAVSYTANTLNIGFDCELVSLLFL